MIAKRGANLPNNKSYSAGDVVKHRQSGEIAVVVERLGRSRIIVSRNDKTTIVWYAGNSVKI